MPSSIADALEPWWEERVAASQATPRIGKAHRARRS
jgi:hypothetical protein